MGKFKMLFVHPSTEIEFIEWLNGQYEQLAKDLSFLDNKNSSDIVAVKSLNAAVSKENETLIAISKCLHNSIINGLYTSVKRRIWRRKMKRLNKK